MRSDETSGTIWATQKQIAQLFDVKIPAISKHLKNIFEDGELQEKEVVSILENTTPHGAIANKTQTQDVKFYNLDAIISVGYRINSKQATHFRKWATISLTIHSAHILLICQKAKEGGHGKFWLTKYNV